MRALLSPDALQALGEVIAIDLMMAGDNAVAVGALAAGLPHARQRKVILAGVLAAMVLRIGFALIATELLRVIGLLLAGGLLLSWVAWRIWRSVGGLGKTSKGGKAEAPKSFGGAVRSIAVADLSMSLDNVLGVAGAAREHPAVLVFGLIFSIGLMGVAANFIARVIERYRWIGRVGLAVIVWVAGRMVYEGLFSAESGVVPALT